MVTVGDGDDGGEEIKRNDTPASERGAEQAVNVLVSSSMAKT